MKKEFYVEILMKLTIEEMEFEMKLLTKKITHNVKNKEKLAWQFWATIQLIPSYFIIWFMHLAVRVSILFSKYSNLVEDFFEHMINFRIITN